MLSLAPILIQVAVIPIFFRKIAQRFILIQTFPNLESQISIDLSNKISCGLVITISSVSLSAECSQSINVMETGASFALQFQKIFQKETLIPLRMATRANSHIFHVEFHPFYLPKTALRNST